MSCCYCHSRRWHHMEVSAFIVHYDQEGENHTLFLGFFVSLKLFVETCLCSKAYSVHSTVVWVLFFLFSVFTVIRGLLQVNL